MKQFLVHPVTGALDRERSLELVQFGQQCDDQGVPLLDTPTEPTSQAVQSQTMVSVEKDGATAFDDGACLYESITACSGLEKLKLAASEIDQCIRILRD